MMINQNIDNNEGLGKNEKSNSCFTTFFNVTSFTLTLVLLVLLEKNVLPSHRKGFYCNDNSIRYPYQNDQTVSTKWMFGINYGLSIILYLIGETCFTCQRHCNKNENKSGISRMFESKRRWFIRVFKLIFALSWCMAVTLMLTSIIKSTVGSLRPHFMEVCKPDIMCSDNLTSVYHLVYTCQADTSHQYHKIIEEARRSFPSGHSSFSAAVMAFNILYIQLRYTRFNSRLKFKGKVLNASFDTSATYLRPFLQIIAMGVASFIAMSRVTDYHHHLIDVLVGLLLGTTIGLLVGEHSMKWIRTLSVTLSLKEFVDVENATGEEKRQEIASLKGTD